MITQTTSAGKASRIAKASPLVRVSAGTLLLAERQATKDLRRAVEDISKQTAGELTQHHYVRDAGILLLLMNSSKRLVASLEQAINGAKVKAREAGASRLQAELKAAGAVEAASKVSLLTRTSSDVQATTTAEAVALAWRQRAIYEVSQAQRDDRSVVEAIGNVNIDNNVTRAAATESAQAYDDGHADAADGLDLSGLVDRWEAMLDACPRCSELADSTTAVGSAFDSGEEPGWVHPRCRCFRVTTKGVV